MFRLQLARAARAHTARRAFTTTPVPRADPFPLPFDPKLATQHDASRNPDELIEEWTLPPPLDRTGETLEVTRARLVYQTRKRGTLETDLLLSTFARDHLPAMEGAEMAEFDKLLDEPDWDIYYWAIEKRPAPERWADSPLLAKLKKHARNEGKVVRVMPDLRDLQK